MNPISLPPGPVALLASRESLGDGMWKLHLLRALRRDLPGHEIVCIVSEGGSPYAASLARIAAPYVDRVIESAGIERPLRLAISRLRALPRFSLVVDLRSNANRVVLARCCLRYRLFLAETPGYLLSQRRPHALWRPRHRVARARALLATIGVRVDEHAEPLEAPAAATERARQLLPEGPTYVGLSVGASTPEKWWPRERFVALAARIAERGAVPVFLLGPLERALVAELRAGAPPAALFPGEEATDGAPHLVSVELTLAIGRRLAAAVANDTGTGHVLAAAGTPLVSLFGPTDPERWAPFGSALRVVRAQDFGGAEMSRIPIDAVERALVELLPAGRGEAADISPSRAAPPR